MGGEVEKIQGRRSPLHADALRSVIGPCPDRFWSNRLMTSPLATKTSVGWFTWLCMTACLAAVLVGAGCDGLLPPVDNGDTNQNQNTNDGDTTDEVTGEIISFKLDTSVSKLDDPLSVLYTVTGQPDGVIGFYRLLYDVTTSKTEGEDTVLATDLPAGELQAFSFDPGHNLVFSGYYRVGIKVTVGSETTEVISQGVVQVQGPPDPVFRQPTSAIVEVQQGTTVTVSFDAQDPEGDVQWRLFLATREFNPSSDDSDSFGTQLETGSGNAGVYTLATSGLSSGDYYLGVSATDTGKSVAATVAAGLDNRIITVTGPVVRVTDAAPEAKPPTLSFLAPATDVALFMSEGYELGFVGEVLEEGVNGAIDLFYDNDSTPDNGFTMIVIDLPTSTTSYPLPTDLPEGSYYIGGKISDGINPSVTQYAPGQITVVRTASLNVTAPDSSLPISPSTGTLHEVDIEWTTNVPLSAGTVDVFAKTVDSTGIPFGPEIVIATDLATSVTSEKFSSTTSGLFEISVRVTFTDGVTPQKTETAPQFVRVSSLPVILWLGSLADDDPPFDGAIFEGVNFEDNAGTSFTTAGDFDDDGQDEFVIASRYGKPWFVNPSGIGPGEAYLIYGEGGAGKLAGVYNLNSVGTESLRGITLTGIRTVDDSDETDGLSDVTLIPDADGDDQGDLVFGFPNTNSEGYSYSSLATAGQFLNGGVVILSSDNYSLYDPAVGTSVINLDSVGQTFSDMSIYSPYTLDVEDLWMPRTDPTDPPCVPGTDGIDDTVVGPYIGFIPQLADPKYIIQGLITPGAPCSVLFQTPADFDPNCNLVLGDDVPGSGFHPAAAIPLEPKGARIIGESVGDGFGTSVTSSNSLGDEGSLGDLIISSPNRTALSDLVEGVDTDITNSGVAYLTNNRDLWSNVAGQVPPTPHQYIIDVVSHCGDNRASSVSALRIAGDSADNIQNILGIDDFNRDWRNDFAVGAPTAGSGMGRVYVAFRRNEAIEGDFVLPKLELDPADSERLTGVLIKATSLDGLGASLATGVDFNGDGVSDLVIGSPDANAGTGEVIVVFGDRNLVSPVDGISVTSLLNTRNALGQPRAARITGNNEYEGNGQFGFNVANAGDVDGDGLNDLLISAPNATPRFDPTPEDSEDKLTAFGVDVNFDGLADDVTGPNGVPDGLSDSLDVLSNAGVVYVIFGSTRLDQIPTQDITINIDDLGGNYLSGFMIAGRRAGDRIGGGDAGDIALGGILDKDDRGRSSGLATAGDVDGDGRADFLIGSILADPRIDPASGIGVINAGEAYLIYGLATP